MLSGFSQSKCLELLPHTEIKQSRALEGNNQVIKRASLKDLIPVVNISTRGMCM